MDNNYHFNKNQVKGGVQNLTIMVFYFYFIYIQCSVCKMSFALIQKLFPKSDECNVLQKPISPCKPSLPSCSNPIIEKCHSDSKLCKVIISYWKNFSIFVFINFPYSLSANKKRGPGSVFWLLVLCHSKIF